MDRQVGFVPVEKGRVIMATEFDLLKLIEHGEMLINNNPNLDDVYPAPTDSSMCMREMVDVFCKNSVNLIPSELVGCGGCKFEEGGDPLYRLLWAFKPDTVDFSDMYGCFLFFAATKCGRFGVKVWLHKYAPSISFYSKPEYIKGELSAIQSGIPSVNNGLSCDSDLGIRFFDYVKLVAQSKQDIYIGNNFVV